MVKLYTECAENITRIVLSHVDNADIQYSDIINMVSSQIEHDLGAVNPKQQTFQREITKFVADLDDAVNKEKKSAEKIVEDLKRLVNQLNKDYLPGLKIEDND